MDEADAIIARLGLAPHPEGGYYAETFRDDASTAILYLLKAGQRSHWHRVRNAAELWHHHQGAPLELSVSTDGQTVQTLILDPSHPQGAVPRGAWQAARPLGGWVLVGCTVAPAFHFDNFEMAPPGWAPFFCGLKP